jgi:hypothetical protein
MSEFAENPGAEFLHVNEALSDLRDRARSFIGDLASRAGVVYQEEHRDQPTTQTPEAPAETQRPPHVCGASCSRCGHGGPQWRPRG